MDGVQWLDAVTAVIEERSLGVEILRPDEATLAVTSGPRGVVVNTGAGTAVLIASEAVGTTIASRLQDRVTHLEPRRLSIDGSTVDIAANIALAHLQTA